MGLGVSERLIKYGGFPIQFGLNPLGFPVCAFSGELPSLPLFY